jgi:4-hydroxy-2-oxoheptanedioate aldolase
VTSEPAGPTFHSVRRHLRERLLAGSRVLPAGKPLLGTFIKLPVLDVLDLCLDAGFDFIVVDLEHSGLSEAEALALVRHAEVLGLPALVRIPAVDAGLVNRLLEHGAAGIQLSMLQSRAQTEALIAATRFAPAGARSVSLANRMAGHGRTPLAELLAAEQDQPPLLVGQIESMVAEPPAELLAGLDVAFVGTTDLAVSLGMPSAEAVLADAVADVRRAAEAAGVAFGGWVSTPSAATAAGLASAGYLITGSDLQILASALRTHLTTGGTR